MTTDTTDETAGRREAYQLGFMLLLAEMGILDYRKLAIESQVAMAQNAGMDIDALRRAMLYLAEYHGRHADELRDYVANAQRLQ